MMRAGRSIRAGRALRPLRSEPSSDPWQYNQGRLQQLYNMPPVRDAVAPAVSKTVIARYHMRLETIAVAAWDAAARTVLPVLEAYQAAANRADAVDPERAKEQNRPHTPAEKAALTVPHDVRESLAEMDAIIAVQIRGINAESIAVDIEFAVQTEQAANSAKALQKLGLKVIEPKSELAAAEKAWLADNASLIKSIPRVVADRVRADVETMVPQGARWETIAKKLRDEYGIAKDRAALIARDQCSKYNGELTKIRQTAAGITHFVWYGANDDRERETHRACNFQTFAWDKPPAIGYPGTPYRCRCRAGAATSAKDIDATRDWTEADIAEKAGVSDKMVAAEAKAHREFVASRRNPTTGSPYA